MAHPFWVDLVLIDDLTQTDMSGRKEASHGQGAAGENFAVALCSFAEVVVHSSVMGGLCSFGVVVVVRSFVMGGLCSFGVVVVVRSFVREGLGSFGAVVAPPIVMEGLYSYGVVVARSFVMEGPYSFAVVVPLFRMVDLSVKLEL